MKLRSHRMKQSRLRIELRSERINPVSAMLLLQQDNQPLLTGLMPVVLMLVVD